MSVINPNNHGANFCGLGITKCSNELILWPPVLWYCIEWQVSISVLEEHAASFFREKELQYVQKRNSARVHFIEYPVFYN
jgi:hypothetical protein